MRVYIDESGTFTGIGQPSSPSVIGALVIPDYKHECIMRQYRRIRRSLPKDGDEVKGRLCDETQIARVVNLLRINECLFFANMIEMGIHTAEGIKKHQLGTGQGVIINLTDAHRPELQRSIYNIKERLERLPPQLYVQGTALTHLLADLVDEAACYFAQRHPSELGQFEWVLDAKGNGQKLTEWEQVWQLIFMPHMQSRSLREPGFALIGADYSHFSKFEMPLPEYLADLVPNTGRAHRNIDLRKLFQENMRISSQSEHELELADIVTNGLRRAFKETLRPEGWLPIRSLMIHRKQHYINVLALEKHATNAKLPRHYVSVLRAFCEGGRSMLSDATRARRAHASRHRRHDP